MTTVKELIEKLQSYPQDLPVIIEPHISHEDSDILEEVSNDIINGKEKPVVLRTTKAQHFIYCDKDDNGDEFTQDEFYFDLEFVPDMNQKHEKAALVITSEYFEFVKNKV